MQWHISWCQNSCWWSSCFSLKEEAKYHQWGNIIKWEQILKSIILKKSIAFPCLAHIPPPKQPFPYTFSLFFLVQAGTNTWLHAGKINFGTDSMPWNAQSFAFSFYSSLCAQVWCFVLRCAAHTPNSGYKIVESCIKCAKTTPFTVYVCACVVTYVCVCVCAYACALWVRVCV